MSAKLAGFLVFCLATLASAGELPRYRVLAPITHGSLTVFPVVATTTHDTSEFLTLDEGLRSGEVVVTEAGRVPGLIRRPYIPEPRRGPEVNRLVLVNNSDRPLVLLAGEIVTGGKQDRVIGKDRIVPAHSDPVDLNVFCVEPGRWTETTAGFKGMGAQMAQPSVRRNAMARKDQSAVWSSVRDTQEKAMAATAGAPAAAEIGRTTSYAGVMNNTVVQKEVDNIAAPIDRDYRSILGDLRARRAVGVVAAIRGQIIWADIFANTGLLERYWPKLVRSYAAEAMLTRVAGGRPTTAAAQAFLDDMAGRREISETDPGVFRHTEISGDGFKVFELTSLLPKTGFDVHVAKIAE